MRRIAELYNKADAKAISVVQDAYLWLLDRTGVYVATVSMGLIVAWCALCILQGNGGWFPVVVVGICGAIQASRYWLQAAANYARFNGMAEFERQSPARHFFQNGLLLFAVIDIIALDPVGAIRSLCVVTYMLLHTVMIRDRDKKPFFETKQEVAMEGA